VNPTEQKAHTKTTDALAARLDDLELFVAALDERVSGVATAAQASIGQERTHRLQLAEQQRTYVDGADRQLRVVIEERRSAILAEVGAAIGELRARTLWGRLRWICFGR